MKNSTKLKIGLVFDDSLDRNDGVQQYIKTLGIWLENEGHVVHYLVGQSKKSTNVHSLSRNVQVRFNGNRLSIPLPANTIAIKSLLNREKYDILHIQMPYSPFMAGKIIKFANKNTAVVGTFHILPYGWLQKNANKTLGLLQKRQINRIDAICSVSESAQSFAKSHYGLVSSVIPNMINLKKWKSTVPIHASRIVFLGRLVPRKGCMQLLKAIKHLNKNYKFKLEIIIAGDGPEKNKLEKYAKSNKLSNVKFIGYVEEFSKRDLLASADIAIFPSTSGESFGIVLIESIAAGAGAVLGGDNPGYRCVLGSIPESLINPNDPNLLADKIQNLLEDHNYKNSLHSKQHELVKNFDVNIVGDSIVKLYNQALLHRRREMR